MVKRICFIVGFSISPCFAEDLGTFGETFEIAEKNLLEEILEKLRQMAADGRMEREQKNMQKLVVENIKHPKAVADIIHTEKPREFEFDPAVRVTRDLKDHKGRVFAKKGDRFNPLEMMSMSKSLLFIDGEDSDHVFWAELRLKQYPTAKVILIKGSPFEVEKKLNREIYFDQQGALTKQIGIRQVPALVYQKEGKKVLTVTESFPLPEKFSRFPKREEKQ
jgi:conjugal transfer pilus assembly protein TraW